MTSSTVLFAMLPLALKLQDGGESRAPLAVVIMGGVISSTLLTLVLVPAVYTILDDFKVLLGRLMAGLPRVAYWSHRQRSPGWVLAPAVAAPTNGNGHAGAHDDGYSGGTNGVVHAAEQPTRRNGTVHEHVEDATSRELRGDLGADGPERDAPSPSYLPSPSGRRRIRVVGQPGEAPAT